MTQFIRVHLDESEKWLDKRRTMTDNYGCKREIDSFKVTSTGSTYFCVQFRKSLGAEFSNKTIGMFEKRKKVTYTPNGKMIINICGVDYQIGTYENV